MPPVATCRPEKVLLQGPLGASGISMLQSGCHGSPARKASRKVLTREIRHWRDAARFGRRAGDCTVAILRLWPVGLENLLIVLTGLGFKFFFFIVAICTVGNELDCNTYIRIYGRILQRIFQGLPSMRCFRWVLLVVYCTH
jgi:hypothetical protein